MPFDSDDDAFVPVDPSQWPRIFGLPHIVVQPDAPPPNGIDDWVVPGNTPRDASLPDDWFVPRPSTMPNAGQVAPGPQSNNTANAKNRYPAAASPDPFAAYWSQIPASRVGAMAWDPPNLPLFPPSSNNNFVEPTPRPAPPILPGSRPPTLGVDGSPWASTDAPPGSVVPPGGFLDALSTLGTSPAPGQGGVLGALATVGSPAPVPSASSLANGLFPGPEPSPMPGVVQAFWQGLGAASRQLGQTVQSVSGTPTITNQDSPAAEPLGWSDLANPSRVAPKVAYQLAQSYPTLAAGIVGGYAGGELGALAGPPGMAAGALIGGSLGAAALSAAQTLGPVYAAELQRTPNDPEGAWNRAWKQAGISGAFSGASWAAFPARFFQSPVKHLVFQMFGVQPALAVGQKVASNIVEGRPATEGTEDAYGQGVVGTAIPALGHKVVGSLLRTRAPTGGSRQVGPTSGNAPVRGEPPEQSSPPPQSVRADEENARGFGEPKNGTAPNPVEAREQSSSATQASRSTSGPNAKPRSRGVWDLPVFVRGRILEKIFGHNLHPNHPTIDIWDPRTGAATSLKSIDLEAPSYQVAGKYVNALYNKLNRDLNELAEFSGGKYDDVDIREHEITSRTLTFIVPSLGTAEQRKVFRNIVEVGKQRGVIVRIEVTDESSREACHRLSASRKNIPAPGVQNHQRILDYV